jgi:hypothetical protein
VKFPKNGWTGQMDHLKGGVDGVGYFSLIFSTRIISGSISKNYEAKILAITSLK